MIHTRKGITPVIAIVLLLLITVGAVGVVYTQFQGLVEGNNAEQELQQQQRIQSSSYSITAVQQTSGSNYNVTVRNTGDETINLDSNGIMKIGVDGAAPQSVGAIGSGCSLGSIAPGDTNFCDTGVSWGTGNDGQGTTIEFQVGDAVKDSYTCFENGNGLCG